MDYIRHPNLPSDDGSLVVMYDKVGERAHRVGPCLRTVDDADLTAAVVGDAKIDLDAVEPDHPGRAAPSPKGGGVLS